MRTFSALLVLQVYNWQVFKTQVEGRFSVLFWDFT